MKDLMVGSIPKHIIEMAIPMGVGMLVQTLYYLVDLYFVGDLGGGSCPAGCTQPGVNAQGISFAPCVLDP